jgi:hypothetical protein
MARTAVPKNAKAKALAPSTAGSKVAPVGTSTKNTAQKSTASRTTAPKITASRSSTKPVTSKAAVKSQAGTVLEDPANDHPAAKATRSRAVFAPRTTGASDDVIPQPNRPQITISPVPSPDTQVVNLIEPETTLHSPRSTSVINNSSESYADVTTKLSQQEKENEILRQRLGVLTGKIFTLPRSLFGRRYSIAVLTYLLSISPLLSINRHDRNPAPFG